MRKGFELLKTRELDNPLDIKKLEKKYHISIPPLLSIFCETFNLGEENMRAEKYLSFEGEQSDLQYCAGYIYEPNKEVMFSYFLPLDFALSNMDSTDEWVENQYIPFGTSAFSGGIVIGTKPHERDHVIFEDPDGLAQYTKIADNIFEFVRGLVAKPSAEDELVLYDATFGQLYQNWGEDFWRVRPS